MDSEGQTVNQNKGKGAYSTIVLREIHLRTTGCHLSMGSHSVICHPTEVTDNTVWSHWQVVSRSSEVNFTKNYTLLYLFFYLVRQYCGMSPEQALAKKYQKRQNLSYDGNVINFNDIGFVCKIISKMMQCSM